MDKVERLNGTGHSFAMVWSYDGRDVPIQVSESSAHDRAPLLDAFAEFLWNHRGLALPHADGASEWSDGEGALRSVSRSPW